MGAAPIQLHPDNPHYLPWRGKPTVLITAREHYGAVLNRDFDYRLCLETLQSHGLNLTRIFSGAYYSPFKLVDGQLHVPDVPGFGLTLDVQWCAQRAAWGAGWTKTRRNRPTTTTHVPRTRAPRLAGH